MLSSVLRNMLISPLSGAFENDGCQSSKVISSGTVNIMNEKTGLTGREELDNRVLVLLMLCPPAPSRLPGSRLLALELAAPGVAPSVKDGLLCPKDDE